MAWPPRRLLAVLGIGKARASELRSTTRNFPSCAPLWGCGCVSLSTRSRSFNPGPRRSCCPLSGCSPCPLGPGSVASTLTVNVSISSNRQGDSISFNTLCHATCTLGVKGFFVDTKHVVAVCKLLPKPSSSFEEDEEGLKSAGSVSLQHRRAARVRHTGALPSARSPG